MAVPRVIEQQQGQVLAFFAIALPAVLLPVAAYAIDAAFAAQRYGELQAATAVAAEAAADRLDVAFFRQSEAISIDAAQAGVTARTVLAAEDPAARLVSVAVAGDEVDVAASETVDVPIPLLARAFVFTARADARLVPGYDSPSSRLPLPARTF